MPRDKALDGIEKSKVYGVHKLSSSLQLCCAKQPPHRQSNSTFATSSAVQLNDYSTGSVTQLHVLCAGIARTMDPVPRSNMTFKMQKSAQLKIVRLQNDSFNSVHQRFDYCCCCFAGVLFRVSRFCMAVYNLGGHLVCDCMSDISI